MESRPDPVPAENIDRITFACDPSEPRVCLQLASRNVFVILALVALNAWIPTFNVA